MRTSSLSFRWRGDGGFVDARPRVDREVPGSRPDYALFLDFEVDGVSLYDAIREAGPGLGVGWLGVYEGGHERQAIRRLLLQEPPDPLLVNPELYICQLCNDLGCGANTVKVDRSDGFYTWREFFYELPWVQPAPEPLRGLGPYHFAEGAYAEALSYATTLTKLGK